MLNIKSVFVCYLKCDSLFYSSFFCASINIRADETHKLALKCVCVHIYSVMKCYNGGHFVIKINKFLFLSMRNNQKDLKGYLLLFIE